MATGILAQRPPTRGAHLQPATLADLVEGARRGDATAWEALVDALGGVVWSAARSFRLSDADAADVFQTTWLHLLEHLGDLDDPTRLPGWLATTARRAALRVLRHTGRMLPTDDEQAFAVADDEDTLASLLARERDTAVRRALDGLAPRDQALLTLLVADPRPAYEEIASTLNMAVGAIGPTRARCFERLRVAALRAGAALPA